MCITGTSYRPPNIFDQRTKWEVAVTGKSDKDRRHIGHVCQLHFKPEDLDFTKGRVSLKTGAIPIPVSVPEKEIPM